MLNMVLLIIHQYIQYFFVYRPILDAYKITVNISFSGAKYDLDVFVDGFTCSIYIKHFRENGSMFILGCTAYAHIIRHYLILYRIDYSQIIYCNVIT